MKSRFKSKQNIALFTTLPRLEQKIAKVFNDKELCNINDRVAVPRQTFPGLKHCEDLDKLPNRVTANIENGAYKTFGKLRLNEYYAVINFHIQYINLPTARTLGTVTMSELIALITGVLVKLTPKDPNSIIKLSNDQQSSTSLLK